MSLLRLIKLPLKPLTRMLGYSWPYRLGACGKETVILRPRTIRGQPFISIGEKTFIHLGATLQAIDQVGPQQFKPVIKIGSGVYVGRYAFIASIRAVTIEDTCVLSDYVYVSDSSHGLNPEKGPIMDQPLESAGPIRIGYSSFIGYRATIMPGVNLGKHCVVGANSVVTRSFPDYSMVGGVPARLIKRYSLETHQWISAKNL